MPVAPVDLELTWTVPVEQELTLTAPVSFDQALTLTVPVSFDQALRWTVPVVPDAPEESLGAGGLPPERLPAV